MLHKDSLIIQEAQEATKALLNHGVVAFPTETVMGLGVIFDDELAYKKLNQVKRRPEDKPYTMMLSNVEDINEYAVIDEATQRVIDKFMPGSITILVPVKKDKVPSYVTHGTGIIGMRIPQNVEAKRLLEVVGKPLLVPSANRSGEKPAMRAEEAREIFGSEIDFVMSGKAIGGVPSTIVDLVNKEPKVVRQGPISEEEIKKVYFGS